MVKRWLSTSETSLPASDWAVHERDRRRAEYVAECAKVREVWERTIGSRSGLLPGATLDPAITPRGWHGHVQGHISQTDMLHGSGNRRELALAISDAYGLPHGAVVISDSWTSVPDSASVWAYSRPGVVDYYERLPHTVFRQEFAGREPVPGQLTTLERAELKSWARKHKRMLDTLRAGRYADMEQVTRRYNRMRAAILDALTRASVEEVRDMMVQCGLNYGSLGEDIGDLLGLQHPGYQ